MKRFLVRTIAVSLFLALFLASPLQAVTTRPVLSSHAISGAPPTINGAVGAGEWPGTPQIVFNESMEPTQGYTYLIPTYVYFFNDSEYIYVLVDVVGDTTENTRDECLLAFTNGDQYAVPEGFGDSTVSRCTPQEVVFKAGFGASPNSQTIHRIYEWKVPLSAIGASPGQAIDFCSPHSLKYDNACQTLTGSLGYDASYEPNRTHDNIWPPGLVDVSEAPPFNTSKSKWGILQLAQSQNVPTLSEWGMILMGLFLAGAAVWTIKRRDAFSM